MEFKKAFYKELQNNISSNFPLSKLMVVTKNRPIEIIESILREGHNLFGENKVQEAQNKFTLLKVDFPSIELHLIGPLQSNKVRAALDIFDVIQSIDREKLVKEILKIKEKRFLTKSFYIQVNIGQEEQKAGVGIEEVRDFYDYCIESGLDIRGLMCIPPNGESPKFFFEKMCGIRKNLKKDLLLSMGMSNDYEEALNNQSNMIRIGSSLFND